jgi:hypothetical protein
MDDTSQAALVFVLSGNLRAAIAGAALISAIAAYSYYVLMRDNVILSRHITGLEVRMNELARRAYGVQQEVFTWESRYESGELSLQAPAYRWLRRRLP